MSILIQRAEQLQGKQVTLTGAKDVEMRLMVGREHGAPTFAMRHFTVAPGGHTPHHSHNYEHEVMILSGEGEVEQDGESRRVHHGDVLYIPANVPHQFRNPGASPFCFMCLVPVEYDCGNGTRAATPGS